MAFQVKLYESFTNKPEIRKYESTSIRLVKILEDIQNNIFWLNVNIHNVNLLIQNIDFYDAYVIRKLIEFYGSLLRPFRAPKYFDIYYVQTYKILMSIKNQINCINEIEQLKKHIIGRGKLTIIKKQKLMADQRYKSLIHNYNNAVSEYTLSKEKREKAFRQYMKHAKQLNEVEFYITANGRNIVSTNMFNTLKIVAKVNKALYNNIQKLNKPIHDVFGEVENAEHAYRKFQAKYDPAFLEFNPNISTSVGGMIHDLHGLLRAIDTEVLGLERENKFIVSNLSQGRRKKIYLEPRLIKTKGKAKVLQDKIGNRIRRFSKQFTTISQCFSANENKIAQCVTTVTKLGQPRTIKATQQALEMMEKNTLLIKNRSEYIKAFTKLHEHLENLVRIDRVNTLKRLRTAGMKTSTKKRKQIRKALSEIDDLELTLNSSDIMRSMSSSERKKYMDTEDTSSILMATPQKKAMRENFLESQFDNLEEFINDTFDDDASLIDYINSDEKIMKQVVDREQFTDNIVTVIGAKRGGGLQHVLLPFTRFRSISNINRRIKLMFQSKLAKKLQEIDASRVSLTIKNTRKTMVHAAFNKMFYDKIEEFSEFPRDIDTVDVFKLYLKHAMEIFITKSIKANKLTLLTIELVQQQLSADMQKYPRLRNIRSPKLRLKLDRVMNEYKTFKERITNLQDLYDKFLSVDFDSFLNDVWYPMFYVSKLHLNIDKRFTTAIKMTEVPIEGFELLKYFDIPTNVVFSASVQFLTHPTNFNNEPISFYYNWINDLLIMTQMSIRQSFNRPISNHVMKKRNTCVTTQGVNYIIETYTKILHEYYNHNEVDIVENTYTTKNQFMIATKLISKIKADTRALVIGSPVKFTSTDFNRKKYIIQYPYERIKYIDEMIATLSETLQKIEEKSSINSESHMFQVHNITKQLYVRKFARITAFGHFHKRYMKTITAINKTMQTTVDNTKVFKTIIQNVVERTLIANDVMYRISLLLMSLDNIIATSTGLTLEMFADTINQILGNYYSVLSTMSMDSQFEKWWSIPIEYIKPFQPFDSTDNIIISSIENFPENSGTAIFNFMKKYNTAAIDKLVTGAGFFSNPADKLRNVSSAVIGSDATKALEMKATAAARQKAIVGLNTAIAKLTTRRDELKRRT